MVMITSTATALGGDGDKARFHKFLGFFIFLVCQNSSAGVDGIRARVSQLFWIFFCFTKIIVQADGLTCPHVKNN